MYHGTSKRPIVVASGTVNQGGPREPFELTMTIKGCRPRAMNIIKLWENNTDARILSVRNNYKMETERNDGHQAHTRSPSLSFLWSFCYYLEIVVMNCVAHLKSPFLEMET